MTTSLAPTTQAVVNPPPWPVYDAETLASATRLIAEGRVFDYGRGPEVAALENAFSERHDGFHALAFNSGTSALYAAFRALGFTDGTEVVAPTFTFQSTASPLLALGSTPVLCDAGEDDGNVSAASIERRITPRTVGVVVTHLFGAPCDMAPIADLCRRRGLALVEDCSHAHASLYRDRPVGLYGDAAVYSVGARKMVSGGHGGVLVTRRSEVFDLACLVGHFKQRIRASVIDPRLKPFDDLSLGGNMRMSPLAAALAMGHLAQLARLSDEKRRLAARLLDAAESSLGVRRLPTIKGAENGSYYDIVVTLPVGASREARDHLVSRLQKRGVAARSPATGLIHRSALMWADKEAVELLGMPGNNLKSMRRVARSGGFERAEGLYDRMVSFPSEYVYGSDYGFVDRYVEAILSVGRGES